MLCRTVNLRRLAKAQARWPGSWRVAPWMSVVSGLGRGYSEGAGAQCGGQPLGGRVWLVPSGEPGADVAGGLGGNRQVGHQWAAGEGEAGHQGDADTGADQGAHEAVVAGAAGDMGTEAAEGGEHVGDIAGVAPPVDPAFAGELGQADGWLAGQRMACGNQQPERVGDERGIAAGTGGGRPGARRLRSVEVVDEREIGSAIAYRTQRL